MAEPLATKCCSGIYKDSLIKELRNLRKHERNAQINSTLYWNPNLWTDENGKAHVEFWNNSTCTDMIISAEGITAGGKFVTGR